MTFYLSVMVFRPIGLAFTESNPISIHKGKGQLTGGVTDNAESKNGVPAWKCDGLFSGAAVLVFPYKGSQDEYDNSMACLQKYLWPGL